MYIDKISITNFRVFKQETTFLLRPFTVLTGPNNSGKSSLIKFLLLLKEDSLKLNFENGKHNLESFQKVLSWGIKSAKIKISTEQLGYKFNYEYDSNGELVRLICFNNNDYFFDFYSHKGKDFYCDPQEIKELDKMDTNYSIQRLSFKFNSIIEQVLQFFKNFKHDDEYDKLNRVKNDLFYDIFFEDQNVTVDFHEPIRDFQENYLVDFKGYHTKYDEMGDLNGDNIYELLLTILDNFKEYGKNVLLRRLRKEYNAVGIRIEYSVLGKFLFEDQPDIYEFSEKGKASFNFFNKKISDALYLSKMDRSFNFLHYISANRGSQKRVLENKSINDINEIVADFSKREYIHHDFLNKCLLILGIEGSVSIERVENVVSIIYLKTGEKKVSLADLGFGYSQLLPIILKIHNLMSDEPEKNNYSKYTLILEEPEANLHPNLQSKLAEVLVYAQELFDIKFIIETHSEYFIRKLQYLTASKSLREEDTVIYYFNDDKYVTASEPKVKEIFINKDGGLSDSFGPGFFDESTRLQFDLIKLNKGQFN